MRRRLQSRRGRRGVAAIELALVMAACVALVPAVLSIGGIFQHYAVLHKAVQEGARAMAALPPQALSTEDAANTSMAMVRSLVAETARQAGLQVALTPAKVYIGCDDVICEGTVPASTVTVSASIRVTVPAALFTTATSKTLLLQAVYTMRYGYPGN